MTTCRVCYFGRRAMENHSKGRISTVVADGPAVSLSSRMLNVCQYAKTASCTITDATDGKKL